ncbi:MAG: formate/nitrite transporter family protein [Phycisphaeraceae bacterium]
MPARRLFGLDAYSPAEIAERVETQGVQRANLPVTSKLMLGVVGGGFIGLGAMANTVITADPDLNAGTARIVGGVAFAMGYLVAITAGAAVFTTNILMVMTWAARKITTVTLLRNWGVVLLANVMGAGGLVLLLMLADQPGMYDSAVGERAFLIGAGKTQETFVVAFSKGMLGNLLICIGVWVAMAGRSTTDKMLGPLLPIAAVPIVGFEHSVGNMFYLPMAGAILLSDSDVTQRLATSATFSGWGAVRNMIAVIAGNIVGGSVMVGLIYHLVYRRTIVSAAAASPPAADPHPPDRGVH